MPQCFFITLGKGYVQFVVFYKGPLNSSQRIVDLCRGNLSEHENEYQL
jgi:hypothetical protein